MENITTPQPRDDFFKNLQEKLSAVARELPSTTVTLGAAALLPGDAVPWPWLHEITDNYFPNARWDLPAWEKLVARVTADRLLVDSAVPQVARMPAEVGELIRPLLSGDFPERLIADLRVIVLRRLKEFRVLSKHLTDAVMRAANGGQDVTAWTVPKAEKVLIAAAYNTFVGAVDNGDGSYNLFLRKGALWEEACLQTFCASQLKSDSLDAIEWALRADYLRGDALTSQTSRISQLCSTSQASLQTQLISGFLLLELSHDAARIGAWRSAYSYADSAVTHFTQLLEKTPQNAEFASLLEEAMKCRELYND